MLVELSTVDQRYHAVLEVLVSRVPVAEVTRRYGFRGSRCTPGCAAIRSPGWPAWWIGRAGRTLAATGGGRDLPAVHGASEVGAAPAGARAEPLRVRFSAVAVCRRHIGCWYTTIWSPPGRAGSVGRTSGGGNAQRRCSGGRSTSWAPCRCPTRPAARRRATGDARSPEERRSCPAPCRA
jgi:hypothetical protein